LVYTDNAENQLTAQIEERDNTIALLNQKIENLQKQIDELNKKPGDHSNAVVEQVNSNHAGDPVNDFFQTITNVKEIIKNL
jgi:Tfp pilus assembly protein PilN